MATAPTKKKHGQVKFLTVYTNGDYVKIHGSCHFRPFHNEARVKPGDHVVKLSREAKAARCFKEICVVECKEFGPYPILNTTEAALKYLEQNKARRASGRRTIAAWVHKTVFFAFPIDPDFERSGVQTYLATHFKVTLPEPDDYTRFGRAKIPYEILKDWLQHWGCHCIRVDGHIILKYEDDRLMGYWPAFRRRSSTTVLKDGTYEQLARWYYKAFRHTNSALNLVDLDPQKLIVEKKYDGVSVLLYFFEGRWYVVSGSARAQDKFHDTGLQDKTIFDLCEEAGLHLDDDIWKRPDVRDRCHMFELLHPEATVCVPHEKTELVHHGSYDVRTRTFYADFVLTGFKRPERYEFETLLQLETFLKTMKGQEGLIGKECGSLNCVKFKTLWYALMASAYDDAIVKPQYSYVHHIIGSLVAGDTQLKHVSPHAREMRDKLITIWCEEIVPFVNGNFRNLDRKGYVALVKEMTQNSIIPKFMQDFLFFSFDKIQKDGLDSDEVTISDKMLKNYTPTKRTGWWNPKRFGWLWEFSAKSINTMREIDNLSR